MGSPLASPTSLPWVRPATPWAEYLPSPKAAGTHAMMRPSLVDVSALREGARGWGRGWGTLSGAGSQFGEMKKFWSWKVVKVVPQCKCA